jgi:hypothetical protein
MTTSPPDSPEWIYDRSATSAAPQTQRDLLGRNDIARRINNNRHSGRRNGAHPVLGNTGRTSIPGNRGRRDTRIQTGRDSDTSRLTKLDPERRSSLDILFILQRQSAINAMSRCEKKLMDGPCIPFEDIGKVRRRALGSSRSRGCRVESTVLPGISLRADSERDGKGEHLRLSAGEIVSPVS